MLPQFTYIASVLDPANSTYDEINKIIGLFINTGTSKPCTQKNWIHKDILYGPKSEGGLNFIDARSFFLSLKISWVKRYASDALYDHWAKNSIEKDYEHKNVVHNMLVGSPSG